MAVKDYLLHPAKRAEIIACKSGVLRTVAGALDVPSAIADRTFTCLHYQLKQDSLGMMLLPCQAAAPPPIAGGESATGGEHAVQAAGYVTTRACACTT
jgi:hypothetical protein